MSDRIWLELISRISASEPVDLDSWLFDNKAVDIENLVADQGADQTAHSTLLWDRDDATVSYLGVRVNERLANYTKPHFDLRRRRWSGKSRQSF